MQPVNESILQKQSIPVPQRTFGREESSAKQSRAAHDRNRYGLPEDFVTLSTARLSALASSAEKKPSVPVTATETKVLRNSFSVYA